jgi:ribosomal protein S18 acetylase RimI-like enzyme
VGAVVREYEERDEAALRTCVIELQDAERAIFSKTADGASIAKPYIDHLVEVGGANRGKIFVVEHDGRVAGYTAVQIWSNCEEIHEEPYEFAYISDLVVLAICRGRGLGRALLEAAQEYAARQGVEILRIGVLAGNAPVRRMYGAFGFEEHKIVLEKRL